MSDQSDLLPGTLDLLILRTLALEPAHGWAIAQRIQQVSHNLLTEISDLPAPAEPIVTLCSRANLRHPAGF